MARGDRSHTEEETKEETPVSQVTPPEVQDTDVNVADLAHHANAVLEHQEDVNAAVRAHGSGTEGELHALRDALGVNGLPGHESTVHEWEASEAGQEWLRTVGAENNKRAEQENEDAENQRNADQALHDRYHELLEQNKQRVADAIAES